MILTVWVVFGSESCLANENIKLFSEAAIVYEINTGEIIYEKNIDTKYYPASTTKLVTAYLAKEKLNLDDNIEFSKRAISLNDPDGSNIGAVVGEKMSVKDALYGLLLPSGNEVANALAEKTEGLIEKFVDRMNNFAEKLGATNTHFVTANGLPDQNHYTTARDMAKIAGCIYKDDEIRTVISTFNYTIGATNKKEPRNIKNTHKMLDPNSECYFKNVVGGKTGYTIDGKYALVTYFVNNKEEYVVVVLKSTEDGRYIDTKNLIQYTVDNYATKEILKANQVVKNIPVKKDKKTIKLIKITNKHALTKIINKSDIENLRYEYDIPKILDSVEKGQVVGQVKVYIIDKLIGQENLVTTEKYYMPVEIIVNNKKVNFINEPFLKNDTTYVPIKEFLKILGYNFQENKNTIKVNNLNEEFYIYKKKIL